MDDPLIEPVPASKMKVLRRYIQFYLYEHSAFTGKKPIEGVFDYPWLEAYWREPTLRWPFWARTADGDVIGFAFVRLDEDDKRYEIAEIFVVNRYRRRGLGGRLAKDIILRFPGPWKLNQPRQNKAATLFWRRVLDCMTAYVELPLVRDDGVERLEQRFVV